MKTQNRILALINLQEPVNTVIESTVNLAKTFGAEVQFLYVKKNADPTRTENQLAVMRAILDEHKAIEGFKNVVNKTQKENPLKLEYTIAEGKVKKTILSTIQSYRPDLVVLGKRKPSMYRLIGNQVTEFVVKNFDGPLFMAHPTKVLEIKENLSLGVLNDISSIEEHGVTNALLARTEKPLKRFKIADKYVAAQTSDSQQTKTIDFTFENNQNALKSLTSYVHKNDVHLLFLDRVTDKKAQQNVNFKEVVKRINTSMLMLGSNQTKSLIKA